MTQRNMIQENKENSSISFNQQIKNPPTQKKVLAPVIKKDQIHIIKNPALKAPLPHTNLKFVKT